MGRREIFIAILGLLIGGVVSFILLSPRVTEWMPQTKFPSAWEPITVTFSRPISIDKPEEIMTLSPAVEGEFSFSGTQLIFQPLEPFTSGQTYAVTLGENLKGSNGLPVLGGKEWSFTVGYPRLLYLREEDETTNLWLQEEGEERQLTQESGGIWDYHAAPNGQGNIYSALDDDGTIDLIQLTLDERERQRLGDTQEQSEVWLLNTEGGELSPAHDPDLLAESGFDSLTSHSARWSVDGRYLSYFKPDARVLIVIDFAGNAMQLIPANLELMGDWSPMAYKLAYTELTFGQQSNHEHEDELGDVITHTNTDLYSHLVLTDIEEGKSVDLSQDKEVDDGAPAWHPDGNSMATGRTFTGSGRQMWILSLGDGESRALTDDPFSHHTSPAWSPDGKRLAFMQVGSAEVGGSPNIWILDVDEGEMVLAAKNAFMPNWWP
jgi:Tol biopolymer transport system component